MSRALKIDCVLPGRILYPSLAEATEIPGYPGRKTYRATILVPKDEEKLAALREAIAKVAEAHFDGEIPSKLPVKDVSEKGGAYEDMLEVRISTKEGFQFDVVNQLGQPCDPALIKGGDHVNVAFKVYAWEMGPDNNGISCGLSAVQFVKTGDRLGGGNAASQFEVLEVSESEVLGGSSPKGPDTQGHGKSSEDLDSFGF